MTPTNGGFDSTPSAIPPRHSLTGGISEQEAIDIAAAMLIDDAEFIRAESGTMAELVPTWMHGDYETIGGTEVWALWFEATTTTCHGDVCWEPALEEAVVFVDYRDGHFIASESHSQISE